jgi:hypothetical protein
MIKKLGTGYLAFGVGVIFGAIIATLTSYYIFEAASGDLQTQQKYYKYKNAYKREFMAKKSIVVSGGFRSSTRRAPSYDAGSCTARRSHSCYKF